MARNAAMSGVEMQTILKGFAFLLGETLVKPVSECSGIW
jgi:hypothetical protein